MHGKWVAIAICGIALFGTAVSAQVLFEQDFDQGNAAGFAPDSADWVVTDAGEYAIDNVGYEIFAWSYAGDPAWTDYILSYDLKSIDSVNQVFAFRVQSPGNCYVLNMRGAPWNDIVLTKWINGWQVHVLSFPFTNENGIWHHFDIVAVGVEFTVHVDGQFQFVFKDLGAEPYLAGGIAAVSYSGGVVQHQNLSLDNVLVELGSVSAKNTSWSRLKAVYR